MHRAEFLKRRPPVDCRYNAFAETPLQIFLHVPYPMRMFRMSRRRTVARKQRTRCAYHIFSVPRFQAVRKPIRLLFAGNSFLFFPRFFFLRFLFFKKAACFFLS
jgi:hypothetical protein